MTEEGMRDRILRLVRAFPGTHLRGLVRELDSSTALARYHLQALTGEGLIRSVPVGGFVRYFPADTYRELAPRDRALLNVLRQEKPLEILLVLLEFGPQQHRDLLEIIGGSKATLSYHLAKLEDAGIVDRVASGEERGVHLRNIEHVRDLLRRFEPLPEASARVHDVWEDLFSGHRRRPRRRD